MHYWILLPLLFLVAAVVVFVHSAYRRDIQSARKRVLTGSSILQTRCGPIEYATLGEGSPVLVLHGTCGGWDQGIAATRGLVPHGFRLIAPSRFGYLRTPFPADPSPGAEAETWACLLDALGIARLPVIAYSAGAAPAVCLALRHSDRVSSLVLIVPGAGGLTAQRAVSPPRLLLDALCRFDFPMWACMRIAPRLMHGLVAVPTSLVPSLPPEERARLDQAIRDLLPISQRRLGLLNEGKTQEARLQYPLEQVSVPTLLISASDDLYQTLPIARHAAGLIPNASLIPFPTGGHLLLNRGNEVWSAVTAFFKH